MDKTQIHLQKLVREVRSQVRRRTLLQGGAVAIVTLFATAIALLLLYPAPRAPFPVLDRPDRRGCYHRSIRVVVHPAPAKA